jgi:hypothetical protein
MDDKEIRRLRAQLARMDRGRGKRYPAELRQRIGRAATELRRRDQSWQGIGAFLGIPHETVRRFTGASTLGRRRSGFVPVMVEDDAGDSTCVLVTPGGYRVEGLGVAGMAELIRRL